MNNISIDPSQIIVNPDGTPSAPITRDQIQSFIDANNANIATNNQTITAAQSSNATYQAENDRYAAILAGMPA